MIEWQYERSRKVWNCRTISRPLDRLWCNLLNVPTVFVQKTASMKPNQSNQCAYEIIYHKYWSVLRPINYYRFKAKLYMNSLCLYDHVVHSSDLVITIGCFVCKNLTGGSAKYQFRYNCVYKEA